MSRSGELAWDSVTSDGSSKASPAATVTTAISVGAMDILPELDTSFLVPCKRCVSLLQAREQFCPFCGEDQSVADDADDAGDARSAFVSGRETTARGRAPIAVDSAAMRWPTLQEAAGHPIPASARQQKNTEIALVRPGALRHKKVLADPGSGYRMGSTVARDRLLISVAAALVLVALAPVLEDVYLGTRNGTGGLRELGANFERVHSALDRGDLGAEKLVLGLVDTGGADDPGVQVLRDALHQQVREQAAEREQPRHAALKASKVLGFGDPAAPRVTPASSIALATPSPEPPAIAMPAPAAGVADPRKKECSESLAALALCPEE